jgi:hypothetical protein
VEGPAVYHPRRRILMGALPYTLSSRPERSAVEGSAVRPSDFPHSEAKRRILTHEMDEKSLVIFPILIEALIVGRQVRQNDALELKHVRGSQLLVQHLTIR